MTETVTGSAARSAAPTPGQAPRDPTLRAALQVANIPTLLLVLTQLTGDDAWLADPYTPLRGRPLDDNDTAGLTDELQDVVRAAAEDAILAHERGELRPVDISPVRVAAMLGVALVENVPPEYGPLLAEEMGLVSRDVDVPAAPPGFSVLVIGAGLSGLCLAAKLEAAGVDYEVLEKDHDVGGTWLENVYPGCGVDTPSHFYSFSFAPNPAWSRYFAKRGEVFDYLAGFAHRSGVREHIRFGHEVVRADFDERCAQWVVCTRDRDGREQERRASVLVSAVGMVNRPSIPPIAGLSRFAGPLMHTAQWQPELDVTGKRVAVIGTGASAMQLVPAIADQAERVMVFQRSKQWVVPYPKYQSEVPEAIRYLMGRVPLYTGWYRLRTFWNFGDRLHESLQIDPGWAYPDRSINAANEKHRVFLSQHIANELGARQDLLGACVPDYPPYVKRPLLDNGWYRTLAREDVELVTEAVAGTTEHSVVTASGQEYEADVVVLATGFRTLQFLWPMEIRGTSGQTLREQWGRDDARAYLGITVPGFPNFFIVNGPNTNAGHGGSAIIATEFEVRYIVSAIAHMVRAGLATCDVREGVFRAYNEELDEALSRSVWSHTKASTYYRNDSGRVVVSSPWKYVDFWARTRYFDPEEYDLVPLPDDPG